MYFGEDTIINNPNELHRRRGSEESLKQQFVKLGFGATGLQSYDEYANMVKEYTMRSLTYQSDALRAFAGITHVSRERGGSDFFWGLPFRFFETALDFYVHVPSGYPGNLNHPPRRRAGFPSWSWTGWEWKSMLEIEEPGGLAPMEISFDNAQLWPYDATVVYYRVASNNGKPSHLIAFEDVQTEEAEELYASAPKTLPLDNTLRQLAPSLASQVLVFETLTAFFPVFKPKPSEQQWVLLQRYGEDTAHEATLVDRFSIYMPVVESFGRHGKVTRGGEIPISLDIDWRRTQPEKLEFVVIAAYSYQAKGPFPDDNIDLYLVLLLDTDDQGISRRIDVMKLAKAPFLAAMPMRRRVYLA